MAIGQRIQKAAQRAAKQRTKRVASRQETIQQAISARQANVATRQAGRTTRKGQKQKGKTDRTLAKAGGGKWSPGSTAGRWQGAADIAGSVAPVVGSLAGAAMGLPPGLGSLGSLGGRGTEEEYYLPSNGNGNGNGGWWASQSQAMQIGIVAAGAAGLWFLMKKK